jgi:hypothetical protein
MKLKYFLATLVLCCSLTVTALAQTGLDSLSPDFFSINHDGSLKYNEMDTDIMDKARQEGVKIIPMLSNHWDACLGHAALDNAESLAMEVAEAVYIHQLDGILVDLENINEERQEDYAFLLSALRQHMPDKIIQVSMALNPHNWKGAWYGNASTGHHVMVPPLYDNNPFSPVSHNNQSAEGPVTPADYKTLPAPQIIMPPYMAQEAGEKGGYANETGSITINNARIVIYPMSGETQEPQETQEPSALPAEQGKSFYATENQPATHGDAIYMITGMTGFPGEAGQELAQTDLMQEYIHYASVLGLIAPEETESFQPEQKLTWDTLYAYLERVFVLPSDFTMPDTLTVTVGDLYDVLHQISQTEQSQLRSLPYGSGQMMQANF